MRLQGCCAGCRKLAAMQHEQVELLMERSNDLKTTA